MEATIRNQPYWLPLSSPLYYKKKERYCRNKKTGKYL